MVRAQAHLARGRPTDSSEISGRFRSSIRPFPLVTGRGDGAKRQTNLGSRQHKASIHAPRDAYGPDLHIDTLKVQARISAGYDPPDAAPQHH
jgi:hypothetical protein